MSQLSASELAGTLNVSKARVSQYVSEGKLAGCFTGDGRARRFDLAACAKALGRTLDKGQLMGNGAATRKALSVIAKGADSAPIYSDLRPASPVPLPSRADSEMDPKDPDRYELARTQKVEEEARGLRRRNALDEGRYALVSEVGRQVAQQIAQEVGQFESVLREGARNVADRLGVDSKVVRQILLDKWRDHRALRAAQLTAQAASFDLVPDERAGDI